VSRDRAHSPHRAIPETIVLGVRPGATPSDKDPVRIFLGTEDSQYRAERVFLWSIEQVRDPGRVYEIHLMKGLAGFRNVFWNTGFTNYRFASPHFAGYRGRGIYNDVDQIYLADPGELFDVNLGDHGYLAVSETDTSVMLMDCEKMGRFWTLPGAQRRRKYGLINATRAVPGTYGVLPPEWNARDEEYVEGSSKLLHYTTIHKQPWRPFPERFYYQPNPEAELWFRMEREANEAGYQPYGDAPGTGSGGADPSGAPLAATTGPFLDEAMRELIAGTAARSVLEVVPGTRGLEPHSVPSWGDVDCDRIGLFSDSSTHHDGVVCHVRLDQVDPEDLPRLIEGLFRRARHFVFAAVCCDPPPRRRYAHSPKGTIHQPAWWEWLFRTAAARHPDVHWRVACTRSRRRASGAAVSFDGHRSRRVEFVQGGSFPSASNGQTPRVWVLTDHKPGHTTQSEGLAEELGWPYELIGLDFSALQELPNAWTRGTRLNLTPASAQRLNPPWPDLVIATGRRTAPVASWIRKQSQGRTRTVQMGRIGAFERDVFDLSVAPAYACLYPDPRRIDTAAPVTRVSPTSLERAAARWGPEFVSSPTPRVALLVGGRDPEHEFRASQARELGEGVAELVRREGGSVLATTSRRTKPRVAAALEEALGDTCAHFHHWNANAPANENPYMGYLALADALVVTGESASMLAEACATGKPVYIYPLSERPPGLKNWALRAERRLADRVTARAYARPVNRRGRERPQRGLELLCAKLLARGFVRTSGHSRRLHEVLVERGLARIFDGKLAPTPSDHLTDLELVADRVRDQMGMPIPEKPARLA
jgi:mitochondrial fission protein ELM1